MLRINKGKAFIHPVTHMFILPGQIYEGASHQEHENKFPENLVDKNETRISELLKTNVDVLTAAIEGIEDVGLLGALLEREQRKTAQNIIRNRIEILKQKLANE